MIDVNDFPVGKLIVVETVPQVQLMASGIWLNPADYLTKAMVIKHGKGSIHAMLETGEKLIFRSGKNVAHGDNYLREAGCGGWRRIVAMSHNDLDNLCKPYNDFHNEETKDG